jgi:hypothetical protein
LIDLATTIGATALGLSIINFIVTLLLTLRRDVGAIRPVLVFTYRKEGWHVENTGNGPALDVIFHRLKGHSVTQNVRLPALRKGAEMPLHFARHDAKQLFVVTYRDADGRPYTTRSQHAVSTASRRFSVDRPNNAEAIERWWQLKDSSGQSGRG